MGALSTIIVAIAIEEGCNQSQIPCNTIHHTTRLLLLLLLEPIPGLHQLKTQDENNSLISCVLVDLQILKYKYVSNVQEGKTTFSAAQLQLGPGVQCPRCN